MKPYELRKVKLFKALSEETTAFSAELWLHGAKVADCCNRGHGEVVLFHYISPEAKAAHIAYCKTLPPLPADDLCEMPLAFDVDLHVTKLLADWKEHQWLKHACKRKTVFRLKGLRTSEWYTINSPYTPTLSDRLHKEYGDRLAEIANEKFQE